MSTNNRLSDLLRELKAEKPKEYYYEKLKKIINLETCPFYDILNGTCVANLIPGYECTKTKSYSDVINILSKSSFGFSENEAKELVEKFAELNLIRICTPSTQSQENDKTFDRTLAGFIIGALAGAFLGPGGAIVGGTIGGMLGLGVGLYEENKPKPKKPMGKRIAFLK